LIEILSENGLLLPAEEEPSTYISDSFQLETFGKQEEENHILLKKYSGIIAKRA